MSADFKIVPPVGIQDNTLKSSNVLEADYSRYLSTQAYAVGQRVAVTNPASDATLTIASPCVATTSTIGILENDPVILRTTGALPTGLSADVPYYAKGMVVGVFDATITVGATSRWLAYCPSNDRVYVASVFSGTVSVINPSTNTVVATITVGTNPYGVAYCPSNDRVYVVNWGGGTVSVINPMTNTVVATITVGTSPTGVAYCPSNDRVYVANSSDATVYVIDPTANTVVATITVGTNPYGVAYCPSNDRVYVVNAVSATVSVINPITNTVVATITVGASPVGVAYCPSNDRVYVANSSDATVSVIDPKANTVVATITVGASPYGVAYCPSNDRVYVANSGATTVSVIAPATNTVVATITVGTTPYGVAYCPSNDRVYTTNGNTVSVISRSDAFNLSATPGGTAINTSGSQSGTHSLQALVAPTFAQVSITRASPAVVSWTAHGFADDDEFRFYSTGTLPTGVTAGANYYAVRTLDNTFCVSTTVGGEPVATTSQGSGVIYAVAQHHHNYESLTASNTGNNPITSTTNWLDLGADNRWAMFDLVYGTQTTRTGSIIVKVKPGASVNSVVLFNLAATSVTVAQSISGWSATYNLASHPVDNWYDWFYTDLVLQRDIAILDVPPYSDSVLTITIDNLADTAACGVCVIGKSITLGQTEWGVQGSAISYSTVTTDTFGNLTMRKRPNAKKLNLDVRMVSGSESEVHRTLSQHTDEIMAFIGADAYEMSLIFGYLGSWSVPIELPAKTAPIEIIGLI